MQPLLRRKGDTVVQWLEPDTDLREKNMANVIDELIETRGLRFHFRDWKPAREGAPVLVLLHGFTSHARSWDAFAEAMVDRYRVIALDQRGHGETAWASADAYGTKDMADDLEAFVRALKLDRFSLLGLSMGGMVAMEYAGRRPRELAKVVIVDIGPEIIREGVTRIQTGVRATDVFESRDQAFAEARKANPRPPLAHHRHRVDMSLMLTETGKWTWRYDRALRSPNTLRPRDPGAAWTSCANIAVPAQLIRGELSDILAKDVAKRMIETIPDVRFDEVKGSGHSVPLDAPDQFLKAARAFLTG
jgi:pimeloyl-ACP methyl ester carboxylesterase